MKRKVFIITGGIGSGKSVVSRICRLRDIEVIDTDLMAREMTESDEATRRGIREIFGTNDRREIARQAFGDREKLLKLNGIVHPAVVEKIRMAAEERGEGPLGVECAIPSTAGLKDLADVVWLVTAPDEIRLRRALERNPEAEAEDIRRRMDVQRDEFSSLQRPVVIDNDGQTPLLPQIENALKQI